MRAWLSHNGLRSAAADRPRTSRVQERLGRRRAAARDTGIVDHHRASPRAARRKTRCAACCDGRRSGCAASGSPLPLRGLTRPADRAIRARRSLTSGRPRFDPVMRATFVVEAVANASRTESVLFVWHAHPRYRRRRVHRLAPRRFGFSSAATGSPCSTSSSPRCTRDQQPTFPDGVTCSSMGT